MTAPTSTLTVRWTDLADPLVRPLLDELAYEYATRYQGILAVDQIRDELEHYPAAEFAEPDGALVLLLEDGEPVAGGAFRRRVEPELGDAARRPRSRRARRGRAPDGPDRGAQADLDPPRAPPPWPGRARGRRAGAARLATSATRGST